MRQPCLSKGCCIIANPRNDSRPHRTSAKTSAPLLPDGERGIPATNYYNPFGVDLVVARRRLVELGDRGFNEEIDLWRAVAGVRGRFGDWSWEAGSVCLQRRCGDNRDQACVAFARFIPALGPSGPDASGRIVCGERDPATGVVPEANVISGCVPLDLFGGVGSITREQSDYLGATLRDRGENSQRFLDVSLEGPSGRLPAGELRWALGAEYRREEGQYRFDPLRGTRDCRLSRQKLGSPSRRSRCARTLP